MRTEEVRYGLSLAGVDPASAGEALAAAGSARARDPRGVAQAVGELALEQAGVGLRLARRLLGADGDAAVESAPGDRRFSDRAWRDNPFLRATLESYLVTRAWAERQLEEADLDDGRRKKARFALSLLLDAAAPSNVPWLNPAVVKEAIDTGGLSAARGFANFVDDVVRNGGMPRQVDRSAFELGRNLAATPGRVVYRNDLFELLAYEPQTETVFAEPLLYSPSWINKYYMLDLAPGRSFVEFAVRRGFTVFAVSYRNPDASLAEKTLDDYVREGLLTALERTEALTRAARVNLVAVCIGGTVAAIVLALLAGRREVDRVGSATLLNSLVDYGDPGDIAVFTDEQAIGRIERRMQERGGFLTGDDLAAPFTWMRGNDLVWRYVVSNWYLGKQPPAFDILAWNDDATRLPAAMHAQFLRACYLDNLLPQPRAAAIDGTPVDLSAVETPVYVLSSQNDHIAPWRSSYRTTQLVGGEARHVLATSGHIAGIVSPPGDRKAAYRTRDGCPPDPEEWLRGSEQAHGSWWEDWAAWAEERSGPRVQPPALPDGDPAPGSYVRG